MGSMDGLGGGRDGEKRDKERGRVPADTCLDNASAPASAAGSVSSKVPQMLVSATPSATCQPANACQVLTGLLCSLGPGACSLGR